MNRSDPTSNTSPATTQQVRFSLRVLRGLAVLVCAVWWGGLTFYAVVVVPLGTDLFGSVEQGFLTQQVTVRLNVLGTLTAAVLVAEAVRSTSRRKRLLTVSLFIVLQASLWIMHARLSRLMNSSTLSVADDAGFYDEHRIYLCLTTVQWLIALWHLWVRCRDS